MRTAVHRKESPRGCSLLAFFPIPINPEQNCQNHNSQWTQREVCGGGGEEDGYPPLNSWLVFWKITINLPNLIWTYLALLSLSSIINVKFSPLLQVPCLYPVFFSPCGLMIKTTDIHKCTGNSIEPLKKASGFVWHIGFGVWNRTKPKFQRRLNEVIPQEPKVTEWIQASWCNLKLPNTQSWL